MGLLGSKPQAEVEIRHTRHSHSRPIRETVALQSRLAPSPPPETLDALFQSRLSLHVDGPTVPKTEGSRPVRVPETVQTAPARTADPSLHPTPPPVIPKPQPSPAPSAPPKPLLPVAQAQTKPVPVEPSGELAPQTRVPPRDLQLGSSGEYVLKLDYVILVEHMKQLADAVQSLHSRVTELENSSASDRPSQPDLRPDDPPKEDDRPRHGDLIRKMREQLRKRKPDMSALEETRSIYKKIRYPDSVGQGSAHP